MTTRKRLDVELVRRGLVDSRSNAQKLIASGKITVGGAIVNNAARQVHPGEPVELLAAPPRFVGRGGEKLDAALETFDLEVTGLRCLDVGASTGGFTDSLLQRGAASVVALDVGHGQLHERIRADPQVDVLERTNIRHVTISDFNDDPFDLIVVDVSFISFRTIAGRVISLLADGGRLVVLIKPQFEAGRVEVSKGQGVIRSRDTWSLVLDQVLTATSEHGAATMGLMVSPLTGAEGNVEFLALFGKSNAGDSPVSVDMESVLGAAGELSFEAGPSHKSGLADVTQETNDVVEECPVTRFMFVPHPGRPHAVDLARTAMTKLSKNGHEVTIRDEDARATRPLTEWSVPTLRGRIPDLVVSIGGDGTMLRALDLVAGQKVPVMGVNMGHLGYLTEVEPDDLEESLERFIRGDYRISERMTIEVSIGGSRLRRIAVNEMVIEKTVGGTVRLQTKVDGKPFLSYAVDGIIVSTSTGSTAYNLSAGGPIVTPTLDAILITPVAPHMLFSRTIVLDANESIELKVIGPRDASVVVDGHGVANLLPGESAVCRRSNDPALIVTFGERDFRDVLKSKFGLTDR